MQVPERKNSTFLDSDSLALVIVYDDWCPYCTRFVRAVKRCDTFGLIRPIALRTAGNGQLPGQWDAEKAKQKMASYDEGWSYGFDTIYKIVKRIPLFYLFVPLLFLLKITSLGELAYYEISVKRKILPFQCNSECSLKKQ